MPCNLRASWVAHSTRYFYAFVIYLDLTRWVSNLLMPLLIAVVELVRMQHNCGYSLRFEKIKQISCI